MSNDASYAKRILVHYIRNTSREAGLNWDSDNVTEIETAVDDILQTVYTATEQVYSSRIEELERRVKHLENWHTGETKSYNIDPIEIKGIDHG